LNGCKRWLHELGENAGEMKLKRTLTIRGQHFVSSAALLNSDWSHLGVRGLKRREQ
jgi:hypothetical protein